MDEAARLDALFDSSGALVEDLGLCLAGLESILRKYNVPLGVRVLIIQYQIPHTSQQTVHTISTHNGIPLLEAIMAALEILKKDQGQ